MVDRVSNISGEAQEMQEKLLSKAHDALIKALESDLRAGIGMDGRLSIWELEFWVKGVGVTEGGRMAAKLQKDKVNKHISIFSLSLSLYIYIYVCVCVGVTQNSRSWYPKWPQRMHPKKR